MTKEEALAWDCFADLLNRFVGVLSQVHIHMISYPEAYAGAMGAGVKARVELELSIINEQPAPAYARRQVLRRMIEREERHG